MANRIATIRKEKGLTLSEVARRAKTTPTQVQKLERGDRRLTLEWMKRLGDALGVKPTALVEMVSDDPAPQPDSMLNTVLQNFPEGRRAIAADLAAEFLVLLLRFHGSLADDQIRRGRPSAAPAISDNQRQLAQTLIRISRDLADTLDKDEQAGPVSRTGR